MKRTSAPGDSFACRQTPIGFLGIVEQGEKTCEIICRPTREEVLQEIAGRHPGAREINPELTAAGRQIGEYFAGSRRRFELPLILEMLPEFTASVLRVLSRIPFAETITYGELAVVAGRPGAARAVGRAMAVNPLPILIPCHRVLGAGGRLVGYSAGAGVSSKEWLLAFERAVKSGSTVC